MSLASLALAVRERRVSAVELVTRSLDRIQRLDGPVNAVVRIRADEALAEAATLDAAAGDVLGPLAGLPLLVKDNEDIIGMPTTFGSRLRADSPPAEGDCEVVARLRGAGAIVVGKTNLPEFAFEGFTSNRLFGDTRNPWALDWSPGGSSGGSGAALAMGLASLATGTDGGGSIRIPAAYCGLVGLKPTNGVIGRDPMPSWIDFSTKGPMATTVADARLLLEVLAGPATGDPTALPAWTARANPWPRRILATTRMCDHGPLPDGVAASLDRALLALGAATSVPIEPIDPPFPPELEMDWYTTVSIEELTWLGRDVVAKRSDELTPYLRESLEYAATLGIDEYLAVRRRRFDAVGVMDRLLGEDAVVVCPTMCVEGFFADGRMPGGEDGPTGSAYNSSAANITGHPSISLPAGVSANGVPFGIQITGPRFADDMVMAVGDAWEAAEPWPLHAPGYEPFDPDV
jgi:Asp-tRNA(Asn)/Glu-tRNA(Gln) amidotransferase A subunit family amidase